MNRKAYEQLRSMLWGRAGCKAVLEILGERVRLERTDLTIVASTPESSSPCEVIEEGSETRFVGIVGMPALDEDQAIWAGWADGEEFLVISTRHLGAARDVFALPGVHGSFLKNVGLEVTAQTEDFDDPVAALQAGPVAFEAEPVGEAAWLDNATGEALVQTYAQGSLDWARGGPFRVASQTPSGGWQAFDLTYGFARIYGQEHHRVHLGAPMGPERHCSGDDDPVHPYRGSYQLFSNAILHWDALTNRLWYQTWEGFVRMK